MSIQTILEQAKADWTVSKHPLLGPEGQITPGYGIFRDDTKECLSVVGSKYHPTQNRAIAEMLFEAANENNIKIERAGMLGNGQKVYFQISLPDVRIGGSDSKRFLTALNSHDGSAPIGFGATNVVVSCANTFFAALRDLHRVRHTLNSGTRLAEITKKMKDSLSQEEHLIDTFIKMSQVSVPSDKITDEFLLSIIGGDEDSGRTKNRIKAVRAAMVPEFETHGQTAYGVFNAITRYTNHLMTYKDLEAKRNSIMSGTAFRVNQLAFDTISQAFILPEPTYHFVGMGPSDGESF